LYWQLWLPPLPWPPVVKKKSRLLRQHLRQLKLQHLLQPLSLKLLLPLPPLLLRLPMLPLPQPPVRSPAPLPLSPVPLLMLPTPQATLPRPPAMPPRLLPTPLLRRSNSSAGAERLKATARWLFFVRT
jgi:hypothetical protein